MTDVKLDPALEIVAVDESGRPAFQALQHRSSHAKHQIMFYAFDVLHVDGRDLTREPLDERRALLRTSRRAIL